MAGYGVRWLRNYPERNHRSLGCRLGSFQDLTGGEGASTQSVGLGGSRCPLFERISLPGRTKTGKNNIYDMKVFIFSAHHPCDGALGRDCASCGCPHCPWPEQPNCSHCGTTAFERLCPPAQRYTTRHNVTSAARLRRLNHIIKIEPFAGVTTTSEVICAFLVIYETGRKPPLPGGIGGRLQSQE